MGHRNHQKYQLPSRFGANERDFPDYYNIGDIYGADGRKRSSPAVCSSRGHLLEMADQRGYFNRRRQNINI